MSQEKPAWAKESFGELFEYYALTSRVAKGSYLFSPTFTRHFRSTPASKTWIELAGYSDYSGDVLSRSIVERFREILEEFEIPETVALLQEYPNGGFAAYVREISRAPEPLKELVEALMEYGYWEETLFKIEQELQDSVIQFTSEEYDLSPDDLADFFSEKSEEIIFESATEASFELSRFYEWKTCRDIAATSRV